jgi:arylsulfatase A-like enzyme
MKPAFTLLTALLLVPLAALHAADTSAPRSKPNIVFILADDLGIVDVNAYAARFTGAAPERMFYETPHIDRLVSQGTAFAQAYASHLCSPARASLLTGRNAARIGFTTAVGGTVRTFYNQAIDPPPGYLPQDALEWSDKAITIPQALLNGTTLDALPAGHPLDGGRSFVTLPTALAGYHSAFIGKWHVGGHGSQGWQPAGHGFKELPYFDEGGSPYFGWRAHWDEGKLLHPRTPQARLRRGRAGDDLGHDYLTDELTAHAVRFIERRAAGGAAQPFFLYLCHFAVHTPFQAPQDEVRRFEAKPTRGWNGHSNAVYAAMLKRLDDSLGSILDTLERTGLARDTVVVFMSDNGGVTYTDPPATTNSPFKGGKAMHFEGGIRVPLVFRWPGRLPAGQWCTVPVECADLFPTLVELSGANPEPYYRDPGFDGRSLVPLFDDPANQRSRYARDTFYWHYPLNVIVKNPDDNQPLAPHSTIRRGDWKLIFDWSGVMRLYDVAGDPFEKHDRAPERPDLALELFRQLNDWLDSNVATKYMPALNPDYDPSTEVRDRPFRDLRREYLGEGRAIRHPDSDPRFAILSSKSPASPPPNQKSK